MANDVMFGVGFMPDFDELERKIQEQDFETEVTVDAEDTPMGGMGADTGGTAEGGQGGGGGGAGGMAGIMEMLGGMSKRLMAILGVVGVLAMLEPIQQMIGLLVRILEIAVLPLVVMLVTLLEPFIMAFMRVIPGLMSFFSDPAAKLESLFFAVADRIGQFITDILGGIESFANDMVNGVQDAVMNLADAIPGVKKTTTKTSTGGTATKVTTEQNLAGRTIEATGDVLNDPIGEASEDLGDTASDVTDFFGSFVPDLSGEAQKEKMSQSSSKPEEDFFGGLF